MHKILSHKYVQKIKSFAVAHKFWATIIVLIIVGLLYYEYKSLTSTSGITSYTISTVQKGTLIVSVTGSGQVASSDQVTLKAGASGNVVYVGAKNGDVVRAGALIAEVDPSNAQEALNNALISLQQEELNLSQLNGTTTSQGILRGVQQKNADALALTYETGLNDVVTIFLNLPSIMSGLQNILYSNIISTTAGGSGLNIDYYTNATNQYDKRATQFEDQVNTAYNSALSTYNQNLSDYKAISRFSSTTDIESLINETYATVKLIAETVKNSNNLIQLYKDTLTTNGLKPITTADTHLSTLNGYTGTTNSELTTLISDINNIQNGKESGVTNGFNIDNEKIKVAQAQNAVTDAKKTLADCYTTAPFDGTVATVGVKVGDTISNGGTIGTFISNQKIATLSLNEVDAAKVSIGQKTTLTFDAIDGLSIAGQVSEVDTLGTVSSGVVTYGIQISFDSQDTRVKPGMTVSASIITSVAQDVLLVPNSAIKTQGTASYVQMLDQSVATSTPGSVSGIISNTAPKNITIQTGLSNDTDTEVTSGLNEGDQIIIKTTIGAITTAKPTTNLLSSLTGGNRNRGTTSTASAGSATAGRTLPSTGASGPSGN